jgi:hypothetical protein
MRRTGDGELAVSGMDCRLMSMLALDGVIPERSLVQNWIPGHGPR